MLSDFVLKRKNFKSVVDFIHTHKVKKIVIVGGSHSGFSAAWMLMNGPADFKVNNALNQTSTPAKFPEAQHKVRKDCSACCHCSTDQKQCACVCKCFGFFRYEPTDFDYAQLPAFGPGDIKILYKDCIRVFYSKVQNAHHDNYSEFKSTVFTNKNGYLYSFTGLRGDAKTLYKAVKDGKEKRLQLI